jgi:hypothetical protein
MIGGLSYHFLKVMAFPNIARWDPAMAWVTEPSGSRKVNEKLKKGPDKDRVGQSQQGCRRRCRSEQMGL